MHFRFIFTELSQRMEESSPTKSPVLYEITDKFASNYKLAVSNNEAILTY